MNSTKKQARLQRHQEIAEKYESGMTLAEVGAVYGVSRERVRQIVSGLGIEKTEGGAAIRSFLTTQNRVDALKKSAAKTESICFARWGMNMEQYRAHVSKYGNTANKTSPLHKYAQQRNNAKTRGVEWNFTFADWWKEWLDSGKWDQRGLGDGLYVMARHGDSGAYSAGNVYICTQSQNSKDSFITSPASVRFADCCTSLGRGRGYHYSPSRSKINPFYVQLRGCHIGQYPTAEAAREAYLQAAAGTLPHREMRPSKKIDVEQVLLIRDDKRKQLEIAEQYGIHRSTVSLIKSRSIWSHV